MKAATLPRVTIYNLASLDGRVDRVADSPEAMLLYYELSYHWKADAILAGSETIFVLGGHEEEEMAKEEPPPPRKEPPPGTEGLIYEPRPLLVVPDSRGRIHNWRLLQQEPWWRRSWSSALRRRHHPTGLLGNRHPAYYFLWEGQVARP